jgi:hypothetical protein
MASLCAESDSLSELKKEVAELRQRVASRAEARAETIADDRGGRADSELPNASAVKTKAGRLKVGGLLQVWAYSIQNDKQGVVDVPAIVLKPGGHAGFSNRTASTDLVRARRAQLRLDLDITSYLSAVTMFDFAEEATAFPGLPTNQASAEGAGIFNIPCF